MADASTTCKKCHRPGLDVYSLGVGPSLSTAGEGIGYISRPGGVICAPCLRAARSAPEALKAEQEREAALELQRKSRAESAARAAAKAPPPVKTPRRRRPRLSAAERRERDREAEADRIAAGGHPWAEDEM